MPSSERFDISVDESVLSRIMGRVTHYRFPVEPDEGSWEFGVPCAFMRKVQQYWTGEYEWRAAERELNSFPQFTAEVDGHRLHFIHERSGSPDATPLILLHGWPGSIVEFLDIIRPLAHPKGEDATVPVFDVVAVSLPGYGFSSPPRRPLTPRSVAWIMNKLMTETLGYDRYVAQGGDWGSMIAGWMAFDHPEHCRALHWNMMGLSPSGTRPGLTAALVAAPETEEERNWFDATAKAAALDFGYANIQATKPQTLGYAMVDSPMGVAAWILEKFHAWSDHGDEPVDRLIPMDRLLTNVMLYLVEDQFVATTWLYRSLITEGNALPAGGRIQVPVGMAAPAHDVIPLAPRSYVEKACNLIHWTQMERGGHFLAMEQPDSMVRDLRSFGALVHDAVDVVAASRFV